MMLGKRQRPSLMKRTTSMLGITVDANRKDDVVQFTPSDCNNCPAPASKVLGGSNETPIFLKTCGLCNRRLAPGRDIFMYRGDTAFCSQECREQRMKQDERKQKSKQKALKVGENHYHHSPSKVGCISASKSSANAEPVLVAAAGDYVT